MSEIVVKIYESQNPTVRVVGLEGEMDEPSLQGIKLNIDPILNDSTIKFVLFDLKDLLYMNSKGIGYLVAVHTHLAKDQRKLILCSAQEAVMDVMSLVGLTTIIPHHETLEEALATAV
ncbi:STAS domain-containing protein [Candidatus Peregrinibacteria bacterium]|nr:STAS domain-containing protein [Candidatus Peregrinibacteria bacterium]